MNYWLNRITRLAELSNPLLEKGYLTIGFSDFTHYHKDFIDKVLDDDWNYFNGQFFEMWVKVQRMRHNLWRFLKFKKGDTVVVPNRGTISVCEIVDKRPLLIHETYSNDLKTW